MPSLLEGTLALNLTTSFLVRSESLYGFKLIGLLYNGTSTQKGQFMPTAGEGNQLSQLSMANDILCIIPHVTRQQWF